MNEQELIHRYVTVHLAQNEGLCRLLALLIQSCTDDIEFPKDKLIGEDWDFARAGQKVNITFVDPYRVETGYLFFLPGLEAQDIYKGGIVHIPALSENQNEQCWYCLKHVAIFSEQIELLPDL
jgi:hypothetical protein